MKASQEARLRSSSPPPPGQASISLLQYRDLFRSYEQGLNQSVVHYFDVRKALFKRGWPSSTDRTIAFFILDTIQGLCNCTIRSNLAKEDILDFDQLTERAVTLVEEQRQAIREGSALDQSWIDLDLTSLNSSVCRF